MNALDYFLKANLYGLLFVGTYWLLLRRHTFFTVNRFYLLASAILMLTLPLAELPSRTTDTLTELPLPVPVGIITLPVATLAPAPAAPPVDWESLGMWAYGLIAAGLLGRVLGRIGRLLRLIYRSPRAQRTGYVLVQPGDERIPTFSFFTYLVINPGDARNELILRHERVHIRQGHSVDVVALSVLRAAFWACPVLWLTERLLRQVHEFLADRTAQQPDQYARFLVDYAFGLQPDFLTNAFFNPSMLKQRIQMLHQRATRRWALGKYILVLPLAFVLLAMTTARQELATAIRNVTDNTVSVSGQVTAQGKGLPGASVVIVGTRRGTNADANGTFRLTSVPNKAILSISFVGFTTQLVPVDGHTAISVNMAPANPDELPAMGATKMYRAIKPNPTMPVRTPPSSEVIRGKVYTAVEEKPVFPTGIPGLMQYIARSLRYPAKARAAGTQGDVLVQFVVQPSGAVSNVSVKKGIGNGCDEEAVRVVRNMPRWIPGKQDGRPAGAAYVLPVRFALEPAADRRTGQITSPQLDSGRSASVPFRFSIDNSKNARFALYNDVSTSRNSLSRYAMLAPDTLVKPSVRITVPNDQFRLSGVEPIYVIDGVEKPKAAITDLKPDKIQSVEVMNDTVARVLYGKRVLGKVIRITTKK